jgi:rhodanese-related sulfurtransferase
MRRGYWISIISLGLIVTLLLGGSCAKTAPASAPPAQTTAPAPTVTAPAVTVPALNSQEAAALIELNQDNPDFVILDVRTPDEFGGVHLANAINIDYESTDFYTELGKLDRSKQYLVYCKSGQRSSPAVRMMVELGFKRVYHLSVGINQWIKDGYPVVKQAPVG